MDQKTWLWRKRSAQKSTDSINEAENEAERLHYEKEAALERTIKNLHEKVASLLCECNSKDTLILEHTKTTQEAIEAREKALAEATLRNEELERTVKEKVEANERLIHVNTALKDYRQQLSSLKEEQDSRVKEAVEELEKRYKRLEEKFTESSRTVANLTVENARLLNAVLTKEELIEDITHQMSRATIEFNELISRLNSVEKENEILKYEYRVLEREVEVRTRCADVAKAKLEAECQKLRSLMKKQITSGSNVQSLDKRMGFMINRLLEVEEENKILKENISKRDDEIRDLQKEFAQMKYNENNGNNGVSRRTMIGDLEMSLMDDFVEMEKLAIVSFDASNLDSIGKELVPINSSNEKEEEENSSNWLDNVLKFIMEQTHVTKRSFDELLEDIKLALQSQCDSGSNEGHVSGYITWKSPETEKSIVSLQMEVENVKESKTMIEEQLENQKLLNEELDHKLNVAKVQINEANQNISALKVELEDRCHCCEELEATCLELQLQLASVSDKDVRNVDFEKEANLQPTGWEITTASAKLAECQETIINIGRQLKALGPPTESAELTSNKKSNTHSSLRDHLVAEDGGNTEDPLSSPKTKEIISTTETKALSVVRVGSCNSRIVHGALAIVPSKKRSKGSELLKKLLFRKKRGSNKKKVLTISA